jgi:hypothetical protein
MDVARRPCPWFMAVVVVETLCCDLSLVVLSFMLMEHSIPARRASRDASGPSSLVGFWKGSRHFSKKCDTLGKYHTTFA